MLDQKTANHITGKMVIGTISYDSGITLLVLDDGTGVAVSHAPVQDVRNDLRSCKAVITVPKMNAVLHEAVEAMRDEKNIAEKELATFRKIRDSRLHIDGAI